MLTWKQAEVRSNKPNAFKPSEFITIFIAHYFYSILLRDLN